MKARAALLVILVLFAPWGAAAFSDEDFCREMQERARAANVRKPAWVDRNIRDDGVAVLCVQKTIEYRKFFNVEPGALGRGWEQRLSLHWSRGQCRGPMLAAIRNGWQIIEITRFPKSQKYPDGHELRAVAACR
jgi:hypothetical protein